LNPDVDKFLKFRKYKSRKRDELQLPFVPQGVAVNKCDATGDAIFTKAGTIKK